MELLNRTISIRILACIPGLLFSLSGCDWTKFDKLADDTWVDTTKSPKNPDFQRYGEAIAIPSGEEGMTVFVWGQQSGDSLPTVDGLAQVSYNAEGQPELGGITFSSEAPSADPVGNTATLPIIRDEDRVLVAVSASNSLEGQVLIWTKGAETPQFSESFVVASPAQALTTLGPDLVIGHGDSLSIIPSYADAPGATQTCTLPQGNVVLGMITIGDNIAVSTRVDNGIASVYVIASTDLASCTATQTLVAPNDESDFGSAMAAGNFVDGAELDLVVAAPSGNRVYVFPDEGADPVVTIEGPTGSGMFGTSLATASYSSTTLVVGAPMAQADTKNGAGSAYLYTVVDGAFSLGGTLHDARPKENQHFGQAVAVGSFNGQDLIVAGADGEIFTYFLNPLNSETDPRAQ